MDCRLQSVANCRGSKGMADLVYASLQPTVDTSCNTLLLAQLSKKWVIHLFTLLPAVSLNLKVCTLFTGTASSIPGSKTKSLILLGLMKRCAKNFFSAAPWQRWQPWYWSGAERLCNLSKRAKAFTTPHVTDTYKVIETNPLSMLAFHKSNIPIDGYPDPA